MATIAQYLTELDTWRDKLAVNLNTMGVSATATENLNTLVPKVLQISGGGGSEKTIVFDESHRDSIYLQYNGTTYSLQDFVAIYPTFCSAENGYALNYSTTNFGWDCAVYTCSITPVSVTAASQIAMQFLSGSTESGIMRLVQSNSGTASDILSKAQTDGSYIDLSLQWLYSTDYITTLTPCTSVTAGQYYLVWVGRSNNSHPMIKSIKAIS